VITLAATIATSGAGASLGATVAGVQAGVTATTAQAFVIGATQAAFTTVCSQAANAILTHQGNVGKAAQALVSSDFLKSITIAATTAGAIKGIGVATGVSTSALVASEEGIVGHLQRQALTQGVTAAVNMATGAKVEEALRSAALGAVAGTVGGIGANAIGQAYGDQMINAVTHKLLHGIVGGVTGRILAGKEGVVGGAIGAMAAETFHDLIEEDSTVVADRVRARTEAEGIDFRDTAKTKPFILEEIRTRLDLSKFTGAVATLLANQDVATGITTATTAVEHNAAGLALKGVEKVLTFAAKAIQGVLKNPEAVKKVVDGVDKAAKTAKAIGDAPDKAGGGGSSTPPDPDDDHGKDHEGDQWQKNDEGRWHHEQSADKPIVPNRPNFENERLQEIAQEVYRKGDRYPGGSAEMLRKEVADGRTVEHLRKCQDRIKNLQRTLMDSKEIISRADRNAAERLIRDMRDAIGKLGA
jgi:hypothetical protein